MTPTSVRRTAGAISITSLLLLLGPAVAPAATITEGAGGALVVTGGPGATGLDLGVAGDGRIRVAPRYPDELAGVPAACEQAEDDPYLALCTAAGLDVDLGPGDDDLVVQEPLPVPVTVDGGDGADAIAGSVDGGAETFLGGAGADQLTARGGADVVEGGPGDDRVDGGAGADAVRGGEGNDRLTGDDGAAVDPDLLDGGPGTDVVTGEWSPVGREGRGLVAVTLGGGDDDGFAGERDDVRGVERLETHTGGSYAGTDGRDELLVGGEATTVEGRGGDDVLMTSYAADALDGGAGADELRGYGGDDRIVGGPGRDLIYGETDGQACNGLTCAIRSGNDVIDARDGERDSIDCGLGTDQLLADAADVHTGCEDVRLGGSTGTPPGGATPPAGGSPRPRTATVAVLGSRSLRRILAHGLVVRLTRARPGAATLTLTSGRRTLARGRATVSRTGTAQVRLRFTAAARRSLRGKRGATLRLTGAGATTTIRCSR